MLKTMSKGKQLKVIYTDLGTMHDIPTWCKVNDCKLVEAIEINNKYQFIVEVK
ncbi:MAG: tRNA 2-thiouridine synthesizing protein A [Francisella sp.]|jgi:tRNA 2-thiouridine synthesizing protein A